MAKTQTRPWDPAEHLESEEDMAAYLNVALDEGDLGLILATLGDIARAQRMAVVAQEAGAGQGEPVQVAFRQRQPGIRHRAQGDALPGTAASGRRRAGCERRTRLDGPGYAPDAREC